MMGPCQSLWFIFVCKNLSKLIALHTIMAGVVTAMEHRVLFYNYFNKNSSQKGNWFIGDCKGRNTVGQFKVKYYYDMTQGRNYPKVNLGKFR